MGWRITTLGALWGVCGGAAAAAASILLVQRYGVAPAGALVASGAIGRILALMWISRAQRNLHKPGYGKRTFAVAGTLTTAASLVGLWSAQRGAAALFVASGLIFSACAGVTWVIATTGQPGRVVSFSPLLVSGAAVGAYIGGVAAGDPVRLKMLAVLVASQLVAPLLLGDYAPQGETQRPRAAVGQVLKGAAYSAASYGPLTIYAVLVAAYSGERWVGPSMLAYAAGSLLAGPLDERLKARWGRYGSSGSLVSAMLAAAALLTWLAVSSPAGLLAGRFAAGALMLLAQGRLLTEALEGPGGGPARVSAVFTGIGLGAAAGGSVAAVLAAGYGVPAMAVVLAGATLLVGALSHHSVLRATAPASPGARSAPEGAGQS